jgi:hypothetical protein
MLRTLVLAAAIMAIGGSEVLAHGARSNFSISSPKLMTSSSKFVTGSPKFATGSPRFVTHGFSTFPHATFSRGIAADRVIVIVRERPLFFRSAFDGCGRRLFVVTPRPFGSPCFACRKGFSGAPWAMQARSLARR